MMFPKTTTAREIQKNYKKVFDSVKKTKEPVFVMKNNKPQVAIVNIGKLEEMEAVIAVLASRQEAKSGQAKVLKGSLETLWNETQSD